MDPTLEFLNAFDVSAVNETQSDELEEATFTISSRIAELLNAARRTDDQAQSTSNVILCVDEHSAEEAILEPTASAPTIRAGRKAGKKVAHQARELPPAPDFHGVFKHQKGIHSAQSNIPQALRLNSELSPFTLFTLFFSDDVLMDLAKNTNAYALSNGADAGERAHEWVETTADELRVFLGSIVYMGVFKHNDISEYWSTSPEYPRHNITDFMTLSRFKQLKRFLHISHPDAPAEHFFSKVEPLSTKLAEDFNKYYIPATNVSVDEMIVRFSGRSTHTVRIKGKPTPEGYKMLALCQAGYTYSFLYTSRIIPTPGVQKIGQLTPTSSAVVHLAKTLPYQTRSFNIYMDNYFSNILLFKHLRKLNIGTCGTARINSAYFPPVLKVDKIEKLQWNTLTGTVVDDQVLSAVWMDNAPVTMLSTIHSINKEDDFVECNRRCPRTTSTNASIVRAVFNGQPRAQLKIPKLIDDYNHNMNGVDLSDQLRSYYNTQLTVFRTWMPLFFWILDTTVVNAYRIHMLQKGSLSHKEFRIQLAWSLIREGARNQQNTSQSKWTRAHGASQQSHTKKVYITDSHSDLPVIRFAPGNHIPMYLDKRTNCFFCRFNATVLKDDSYNRKTQSSIACKICNVALCIGKDRNCFEEYHTK